MLESLFNKVIEVSYRNQSIDLLCKSMDRFLYDGPGTLSKRDSNTGVLL